METRSEAAARQKYVHYLYTSYLNEHILFNDKKDQFLSMVDQLKTNVDRLLPLSIDRLSTITFDFYAMVGSTAKYLNQFKSNSMINMVYSSTPLITYIHTFFNSSETSAQRDNLTLYMLTRLIERLILLMNCFEDSPQVDLIIGKESLLPHPFSEDAQETYAEKIRERYGLDLSHIVNEWDGNQNDLLLYVILLTSLTSLENTMWPPYENSTLSKMMDLEQKSEEYKWKMFMGCERYHLGVVDRDAKAVRLRVCQPEDDAYLLPINHIGYSYDAYLHRLGERLNGKIHQKSTIYLWRRTTKANSNLETYPMFEKYPRNVFQVILDGFTRFNDRKDYIDNTYDAFVAADFVQCLEEDFQRCGVKIIDLACPWDTISLLDESHPTYQIRDTVYKRITSDAAFGLIIERKISSFLFEMLDENIRFGFPHEFDKVELFGHGKLINLSRFLTLGSTSTVTMYERIKYKDIGGWRLLVGSSICDEWASYTHIVKEGEIAALIVRLMGLLCMDLEICPENFMVNVTHGCVVYVPSSRSRWRSPRPAFAAINDNYHAMLMGDAGCSFKSGQLVCSKENGQKEEEEEQEEEHSTSRTTTNLNNSSMMKYMWKTGCPSSDYLGESDLHTAFLCRGILTLIKANTLMFYHVLHYNQRRFLFFQKPRKTCTKKVNLQCPDEMEKYQNFVNRVHGLHKASVDLYNFFFSS